MELAAAVETQEFGLQRRLSHLVHIWIRARVAGVSISVKDGVECIELLVDGFSGGQRGDVTVPIGAGAGGGVAGVGHSQILHFICHIAIDDRAHFVSVMFERGGACYGGVAV